MTTDRFEKSLLHYCDLVWEYDRAEKKTYIHCDALHPHLDGKWYDAQILCEFYKKNFMFESDFGVWESHMESERLGEFLNSDVGSEEFEVRFSKDGAEPVWYRIILEKSTLGTVVITGQNIYNKIREQSLKKAAEKVFENIMYIDVVTNTYILHHKDEFIKSPINKPKYDEMIELFVKKYVLGSSMMKIVQNMKLQNVLLALKDSESYTLYVTVQSEKNIISYKKLVFSYLDSKRNILALVRSDVSGIAKEYEHQLKIYRKESYRDALTGAYNRKYFEEKLKKTIPDAGVAIIDLDNFKLCNDTYGHSGGDAVLICAVKAIRECTFEIDTVIRYGGDEFLVIFPKISRNAFERRLRQLREKVGETVVPGYENIKMSVSIGGVIINGETVEQAVDRADKLMYLAKNKRNSVVTENNENSIHLSERQIDDVRYQVLIVDDSEISRDILTEMLGEKYKILTACDGAECIDMLNRYGTGISLVLLDLIMPVLDGYEVLAYMNRNGMVEDIPVIMISVENSDEHIKHAYNLGVSDYISRPFDSRVVYRRVSNLIKLYSKQRKIIELVTRQSAEKGKNTRLMADIFGRALESLCGMDGSHFTNVSRITAILLEALVKKTDKYGLSWEECVIISEAAKLHDIGKAFVDEKIIKKSGSLGADEFEIMKTHTVLGAHFLESLPGAKDEKLVETAAQICLRHHERYDGGGYPDGLAGDEIPIAAQVVSLADTYDTLVNGKAFKDVYSHEEAVQMIINGKCGSFNPILLACLSDVAGKICEIC